LKFTYYPDEQTALNAPKEDIPLLVLTDNAGDEAIICDSGNGFEHDIVLRKLNYKEDVDKYFRVVVDRESAEWTFVCPPGYKSIEDKNRRIEKFFGDGVTLIKKVLGEIGYDVPIEIPRRYRRHMEVLANDRKYLE